MKQAGETTAQDEPIVELETDKVTLEVPSPVAGTLSEIIADEGVTVEVGALLARVEEISAPVVAALKDATTAASRAVAPAPQEPAAPVAVPSGREHPLSPAVRRLVEENSIDPDKIRELGWMAV